MWVLQYWALTDDLGPVEKLVSHQLPSGYFKYEFINIGNSSTISSSTTVGSIPPDPGD